MSKNKLLPIWAAISAVLIIGGIVLMALLGFNTALDQPEHKTFDVYYNVVVDLNEGARLPSKRTAKMRSPRRAFPIPIA